MLKRSVFSIVAVLSLQTFASADVIVGYGLDGHRSSGSQSFGVTNAFTVGFTTGAVSQVLTNVQAYLSGFGNATVSFYNATVAGLPTGGLLSTSTVALDGFPNIVKFYTFSGFAPTTFQANSRYVAVINGGALLSKIQGTSDGSAGVTGTITSYHTGQPSGAPFVYSSIPVAPLAFQINGSPASSPVIPEPSSLALLGALSLAGLGVKRLRGRRSQDVADSPVAV